MLPNAFSEPVMPDLSTRYLGLDLKNPLVPSSTPLSRELDAMLHLEDAGAAAIVMHSLFEEDIRGGERDAGRLDAYLEQVARLKSRLSIPVVASLNGSSLGGWVALGQEVQAAGADALEINAWYLPSDPEVPGEAIEERYLGLLHELREQVGIPVGMKLSPFFSSLPHFVRRAEQAGAAGVSLFNRFFQPDIDLSELKVVDHVQLSTSADNLLAMRWIAVLHGRCRLSLAASGGVHNTDDALKMLLAGADVVHLASVLLLRGPAALAEMLDGLRQWMARTGHASLAGFKGALSQRNLADPGAFARAAYLHALDSFTPPAGVSY